ncbi:MAG: hypothetical protein ABI700_23970, partial [Chloroflexota bacterium]
LAIAIVGALAITIFTTNLSTRTDALSLSDQAKTELRGQASQFGAAQPPADLSADQTVAATEAIKLSFVDTFRVIAGIGAALALLSAVMSVLLIENRPGGDTKTDAAVAET